MKRGTRATLDVMNWIWVHKNRRIIIAATVGLCVVLLAIPLWVSYQDRVNQQASEAYFKAGTLLKDGDVKSYEMARDAFAKVGVDYAKSKVVWLAKLQVANLNLKLRAYEQAAKDYERLLTEVDAKNALRPVMLQGLVSAYEGLKNSEKVAVFKKELDGLGFGEK